MKNNKGYKKKVVVYGAGGFGRETIEIFKAQNETKLYDFEKWDILGFVDDDKTLNGKIINGYPVIGNIDWFKSHKDVCCVCSIADSKVKRRIIDELTINGIGFVNAIHPSAIIGDYVKLGKDIIIGAGCILTTNIIIKDHVIINLNCIVGHDSVIEQFCSIMPTCSINGNCHIHADVYIGTGASLIQDIDIGDSSTVGAGAVIIDDVPKDVVVVGVPAKIKKYKLSVR